MPEEHELAGVCNGKRSQHDHVEQAEDRGVGADAEGKGEDGDEGEARAGGEHAQAVAQVLREVLEGGLPAGGTDAVLDGVGAAHLNARRTGGLVGRHAGAAFGFR